MSSPYLVLEVQVVELLPPVLGSLSSGLHLAMLRVGLVMVVLGELMALVIKSREWRNHPAGIPNVDITSMRTDVVALASGLDGS